jgi:hypothetical protein
MILHEADSELIKRIVWTDEAIFKTNERVN